MSRSDADRTCSAYGDSLHPGHDPRTWGIQRGALQIADRMGFVRPRNLDPRDSEEVDSLRGSPAWDEDEKQGTARSLLVERAGGSGSGETRWTGKVPPILTRVRHCSDHFVDVVWIVIFTVVYLIPK